MMNKALVDSKNPLSNGGPHGGCPCGPCAHGAFRGDGHQQQRCCCHSCGCSPCGSCGRHCRSCGSCAGCCPYGSCESFQAFYIQYSHFCCQARRIAKSIARSSSKLEPPTKCPSSSEYAKSFSDSSRPPRARVIHFTGS